MEGVQLDPNCGLAPGPQPPPGTIAQADRGYGNTSSTRSRALERGRSVELPVGEKTVRGSTVAYDGSAITACGTASSDGVPSAGYAEQLQGHRARGEAPMDEVEKAWEHSLRTEGLHPAEADTWPDWMGISTSVGQRPTTPAVKLEEDSQSDGSFEKLA